MADAFVIGAGPAGLAAAIALRLRGLSVNIADSLSPPIDKACGEGLMPDALHALGQLGVSIPSETCFPFRGIRFEDGRHRVDADFPRGAALGVRRTTLHSVLAERAERIGVRILWRARVTGIHEQSVEVNGARIAAGWIIGADGAASRVRTWARLDRSWHHLRRFGFRWHYRQKPWTDCMEIYWGAVCQVYVTPVAPQEICVAVISRDPKLRINEALAHFPCLRARIDHASLASEERGAVTASRRLRRVTNGRVALIGDASGSVDAITGEGLCLGFRQSLSLAAAIAADNLPAYEAEHRRILRRPAFMAAFMLRLGESPWLRSRAMQALARKPELFARMLAMHVGESDLVDFALAAASLGARMLAV